MNILEHEIIEKFRQLDEAAQQRIRDLIGQETVVEQPPAFDFKTWWSEIESVRVTLKTSFDDTIMSASDWVNLVREEHDDDKLKND